MKELQGEGKFSYAISIGVLFAFAFMIRSFYPTTHVLLALYV